TRASSRENGYKCDPRVSNRWVPRIVPGRRLPVEHTNPDGLSIRRFEQELSSRGCCLERCTPGQPTEKRSVVVKWSIRPYRDLQRLRWCRPIPTAAQSSLRGCESDSTPELPRY